MPPITLNSITVSGDCTNGTVEPTEGSRIRIGDVIEITCYPNTAKNIGDSFTVDIEIAYMGMDQEQKESGSLTGTIERKTE